MTLNQFRAAFGALQLAISYPRERKPASLLKATSGYAPGIEAKPENILTLSKMTIQEIFDLRYQLEAENAKGSKAERQKKS